ncbi:unnamed protein product [Heterobilharzia americana]|nr:unnamed protein product [Heterobilharzia americana]
MFGFDLVPSFFPANICSNALMSDAHFSQSLMSHERVIREVRQEYQRLAREIVNATSIGAHMLPREFGLSHTGNISHIQVNHQNGRVDARVTLGGQVVVSVEHSRVHRHRNDDPVPFERTRLQWYDSNTRRPLLPEPSSGPQPSRYITTSELAKLPISIYRVVKDASKSDDTSVSPDSSTNPPSTSAYIPVLDANQNHTPSPGSVYLQPEAKRNTLVPIQPIQSSPARGQPECEICLSEYQNKDRLRHLPCGHAFHVKCIDPWLKGSITCPKCRASVRTGLTRLERARQRLVTRSNVRTCSRTVPGIALRQRPSVPIPSTQEQNRSSRRGQDSSCTNRSRGCRHNSVGDTTSVTPTVRITRARSKATNADGTTSTTAHRPTNTVSNRKNQRTTWHSNSSQPNTSSHRTEATHEKDDGNGQLHPNSKQADTEASEQYRNRSLSARRKAIAAAMQRETGFRGNQ